MAAMRIPQALSWRQVVWGGIGAILLLPLIAMPFTDEVNWGAEDFLAAALLLVGTALAFEVALRLTSSRPVRMVAAIGLLGLLLLTWAHLAVGIF